MSDELIKITDNVQQVDENYNLLLDNQIISNSNGEEYIGQVMNKMKCGIGILSRNNKVIYKGEWKNDLFNGEGTHEMNDNLKYFGSFLLGKKHGKGIITSADGSYSFDGEFENDLKNGVGKNFINQAKKNFLMEHLILGNLRMVRNMEKENLIWKTGHFMTENSKMIN